MKYSCLVMFIFISSLWGGSLPPIILAPASNDVEFNFYANQEVDIKLPKKFKIGKNDINITLSNPKFPSGYIVAAYVDLVAPLGKNKPEIEDGYPTTTIEIFKTGNYTVKLKVNLIYKSS